MCYPAADLDHLRVCCDFMNYLFHIDDLSDDMDNLGTVGIGNEVMNTLYHPNHYQPTTRLGRMTAEYDFRPLIFKTFSFIILCFSYWKRFIKTGSLGAQQRFMSTFDQFFQAITIQAIDRKNGTIPGLESYIAIRRDTSGCKPCWALIEYANNLNIPDEVMEHPIIRNLDESANDLVTWSNVSSVPSVFCN
jgi:Terpene synthase family 2, C-terminal metal binding